MLDNLLKNGIKNVLNIGYRHDSDKTVQNILEASGIEFSVLEVYGPNCEHMKLNNTCKEIFPSFLKTANTETCFIRKCALNESRRG